MNHFLKFIAATIQGGIMFLLPVTLLIIILRKTVHLVEEISKPIVRLLPFKHVAGLSMLALFNVVIILLICFVSGLLIRTRPARKLRSFIENRILVFVPGYLHMQAIFSSQLDHTDIAKWKPALIKGEESETICFVVDESEDFYTVFIPSAPNPASGSVGVRIKSSVVFLPISVMQANQMIRKFGRGAAVMVDSVLKSRSGELT